MLDISRARRATLATFKRTIAEGASDDLATRVALARYRAFFPTANEIEATHALSTAIASEESCGIDKVA